MNRLELRQIIKEELQAVLRENNKEGTGEIAVKKSDKAKAEKIMAGMNLEFEDLGAKDSTSLNYFKLPNSNWEVMNQIGTRVDLQSMTIL